MSRAADPGEVAAWVGEWACPYCDGDLVLDGETVVRCVRCGERFQVVDVSKFGRDE